MSRTPNALISYSWEGDAHRKWVRDLATRLRGDGIDVTLDQWHMAPGDQLTAFMEKSIRENDFVIIVCTPRYKERSDRRAGGVGYEGDIMTAEVLTDRNHRKFIPIIWQKDWENSAPSWLKGKCFIDLSGADEEENYDELRLTLLGRRPEAPPIGEVESRKTVWIGMVPRRNPFFTGRENVLEALRVRLAEGQLVTRAQAITGLGGIGKTQAVVEYCHRHVGDYPYVLWVNAASQVELALGFAEGTVFLVATHRDRVRQRLWQTHVNLYKDRHREQAKWLIGLNQTGTLAGEGV